MFAAIFVLSALAAEPKQIPERSGLGFAGLPLVNYNSDEGFGYGARAVLYDYGNNQRPYRYALTAQFFQTTNHVAIHRLFFDAPRLADSAWRVDGELRYYAEKFAPYYGLGNNTSYDATRGTKFYSYEYRSPQVFLNARRELAGSLQFFGGYFGQYTALEVSADSKLIEDFNAGEPLLGLVRGPDGGFESVGTGELTIGLVVDSRDNEPAPTSGVFHELSVRGAAPLIGSDYDYVGANLTLRYYRALDDARRVVIAGRLMVDVFNGRVPFFRLGKTGGLKDYDAVGGLASVRGILKNRYVGKIKTFATPELRWTFLDGSLFDQHIQLTVIAAVDAGRAWKEWSKDGSFFELAYGAAGGLRIGFNENFIVRVDYARELGGDNSSGLYIDFNHTF